jgi:hypothetical protein
MTGAPDARKAGLRESIARVAELIADRLVQAAPLEATVRAWPALARTHVTLRGALTAGTRERVQLTLDAPPQNRRRLGRSRGGASGARAGATRVVCGARSRVADAP